jgi:uncharacterized protein (TIGR02452 family)
MFSIEASPRNIKKLTKPYSPTQWLINFEKAKTKNFLKLTKLRIDTMNETFSAFVHLSYLLEDSTEIKLDSKLVLYAPLNTKSYNKETKYQFPESKTFETKIEIVEGDCLEIGLFFKNKMNLNPVVLNMANENHPGGGYRHGSGAQEENLHRRTNLFQCLDDPTKVRTFAVKYPIPPIGGIYSPQVCVIRGSESKGYPFFKEPDFIGVVTVAAIDSPKLKKIDNVLTMNEKDSNLTKDKMRIIFNIALENGHDCVILSAFGCGAFENPPHVIAGLFKEVMKEYDGKFKTIVFAIFNDHNSNKKHNKSGNIQPFVDVFGVKSVPYENL